MSISNHGIAREQLRAFIERIERLEEEKKAIADDIKEVYAEAKGNGYDPKIMRECIKLRKQEPHERAEHEAVLDLYKHALGLTPLEEYADEQEVEPDVKTPTVAKLHPSDDGIDAAHKLISQTGKASTSFIQRNLSIGYNKAARIMEALEQKGFVSKANHAGKRQLLINADGEEVSPAPKKQKIKASTNTGSGFDAEGA